MAKSKKSNPAPVEEGETINDMGSTTDATPKRTKGHKARFMCEMLAANEKNHEDDAALAAKLEAEYPGERDWVKNLQSIRAHYNAGKFTGQPCPPPVRSVRYVNGEPAKRAVKNPTAAPKAQKSKANAVRASKPPAKLVLKKKTK